MPYDPNPPTERERANAYFTVWIGLAASLVATAAAMLPLPDRLGGFGAMVAGLWMLVCVFSRRFDSYFRELRDVGAVVALTVVALWLAVNGTAHVIGGVYAAGFALGSDGADSAARFVLPGWIADPWLVAALAALGFHGGFLIAQFRGGR